MGNVEDYFTNKLNHDLIENGFLPLPKIVVGVNKEVFFAVGTHEAYVLEHKAFKIGAPRTINLSNYKDYHGRIRPEWLDIMYKYCTVDKIKHFVFEEVFEVEACSE